MRFKDDESQFTPGYKGETIQAFQSAVRITGDCIRNGVLEPGNDYRAFDVTQGHGERQNFVLFAGILYMVNLPCELDDKLFAEYCAILWQLVNAVPITTMDGSQRHKFEYWLERWDAKLKDAEFWHNLISTNQNF